MCRWSATLCQGNCWANNLHVELITGSHSASHQLPKGVPSIFWRADLSQQEVTAYLELTILP